MTCGCARLEFADGSHGILIAAAETVGRAMPLVERLQRLVEGIDSPIAAFARDGMFVGASDAARPLLGFRNLSEAGLDAARSDALSQGRVETPVGIGRMVLQRVGTGADVGLVALIVPAPPAAEDVPEQPIARGDCRPIRTAGDVRRSPRRIRADRRVRGIAAGRDGCSPAARARHRRQVQQLVAPPADLPAPDYEQPAISGEAPAEFALIDEFAEPDVDLPSAIAARRRHAVESLSYRSDAGSRIAADPPGPPSMARRARACSALPSAALHVADGCRRPLLARLG